jgi:acetyl esterase
LDADGAGPGNRRQITRPAASSGQPDQEPNSPMSLDPQAQAVLDAAYSNPDGTAFDTDDPEEARRRYAAGTAAFAPETPALEAVEEMTVPGPAGEIPARLYRPKGAPDPAPLLVFFHGGGWVFGDMDTHDHVCRALADAAKCLILSVDYRLSPPDKFPAAVEDCLAATAWAHAHADGIGADPERIAVGGDSAGGNLAAVVAQSARDAGSPPLVFQLLIYPATDFTADTESMRTNGEGYLLTKAAIDWCKETYLRDKADETDPRASPLLAKDFSGLPDALVITAEYDPLRDEGSAYAEALADAGCGVVYREYDGMVHGFMRMGALVDRANEAIEDSALTLRHVFGT